MNFKNIAGNVLKWLSIFLITLLILIFILIIAFQIPFIQNKAIQIATKKLSETLNTEVSVGKVSIDFLTNIHVEHILVRDYKNDTMLYIRDLNNHYSIALRDRYKLNEEKISIDGLRFYLDNTRADSVFNITHTFAKNKKTEKASSPSSPPTSKPNLRFLKFGNVMLTNTFFRLKDKYNYQTISFLVEKIDVLADQFHLADSPFQIARIAIKSPQVTILHHQMPYRPKDLKNDYLHLPFVVDVGKLSLENAALHIIEESEIGLPKPKNVLSFRDLDVRDLDLEAEDVKLRKPSIRAHILKLKAREKSGLEIQELHTDFYLSSYRTEAKNLRFKTANSSLKGYLRFDYKHMREYFRFAAWVKVTAKMHHSNLSFKDMAYFTPALDPWKHLDVKFQTNAYGTMNDLMLRNLMATLNHDRLKAEGEIRIMDLFSGKGLHTIANLKQTSFDKNDIGFVFQNKKLPAEMDRLGRITYRGLFKGNPLKFTLDGQVQSLEGAASLKETSFDFTDKKLPKYKGHVALQDFKLANIVGVNNPVNHISADLIVDGQGFDIQTLNSYVKGHIQHISIQNSIYNDIDVDGTIHDKIFRGNITSNDPSLNVSADGRISMQSEKPDIELNLKLKDIDLKKLGLSQKQLLLNSNVFAIGRGKSIDEVLGTIYLRDMYLLDADNNRKRYDFSTLTVEKDMFEEGDQYLNINSDEVEASLVGQYKITDIPVLMKEYLISYITIDPIRANQIYSQTYFNLDLKIKNIKSYTKLFYEDLKNIERGNIEMRFDGFSNKLKLNGQLYHTEYKQFKIPHLQISNESSNASFIANMDIDSVFFQNKLAITPLKSSWKQMPDGLKMAVELLNRDDEKFVDFNTIIKKKGGDIFWHILPFTSYYGRKVWSVHPDNEIVLNTDLKTLTVRDFELYKDRQLIRFSNKSMDNKSIDAKFENVKLEELISGFMPILKSFKGNLNGDIEIENILSKPTPVANLDIDGITYDEEKYGHLVLKSTYQDEVLRSTLNLYGDKIKMTVSGSYNANEDDYIDANANITELDVDIFNKYLKGLAYEMDGHVRSAFHFYGSISNLQSEGHVYIDTLTSYINNIHTRYHTTHQKITMIPGKFVLDDFQFKDDEGHRGVVNGFIAHEHFRKFDLFLDAESPNILCMNTNATQNASFYGKVYAELQYLKFRGTIGDRLTLSAKGKNLPNSLLTIAFGTGQQTEKFGFYEFAKKEVSGQENAKSKTGRKLGGVNFDFSFDINTGGKLFIVMDPTVDDHIECTGKGHIDFKMIPETDMDIKGYYEINSGTYLFTYQNLVQRVFYLENGGKMTFVGNPWNSTVDAEAKFITRANAQDLINSYFGNSTDPRVLSAAKTPVKAIIKLKLKDRISQPKISYELDVEQNTQEIQSAFESIKNTTKYNDAELNNQVMGLLVFKRFFPSSISTANKSQGNNVTTDIVNQAYEIVTSKVTTYINEWMQTTFRGMNFDLNLRGYNQSDIKSNAIDARTELKLAISQKLFNDRFIFNIGGNYDFGKNQISNSNTAFFGGDVDLEYLFPPNGNIRGKIYSTLTNDPLSLGYYNKTGMGIKFQREFDKFSDLFKKGEK